MMAGMYATGFAQTESKPDASNNLVYDSAKAGGPRRFVANSKSKYFDATSTASSLLGLIEKNTVLANLGCELVIDHQWCYVRPIKDGSAGYIPGEFLDPAVGPDGFTPTGENQSNARARKRRFDATAEIPCAQIEGQQMGICKAQIARAGGGDAAVVATFSNDFSRTLYFVHGMFISANATMSGVGRDIDWRMDDGVHFIRVDDQQYEIPDAFILGIARQRAIKGSSD